MEIDYYEILEISKNANKTEIKKAYRKLALKYHPDTNDGDKEAEERFKLINEAYEILGNEEKRALYDKYGKEGLGANSNFDFGFDINDIFSSFFGSDFGFSQTSAAKAKEKYSKDLKLNVTLEFKEAVFGTKKKIKYKYKEACKDCKGSGSRTGKNELCPQCNGKGQIAQNQGFLSFVQTCSNCEGSGFIISDRCSSCKGSSFKEIEDSFELEIPEGVNNGLTLRVANRANIMKDGQRGDLYVRILVKDDNRFLRRNDDLYIEIPVLFTQAALGAKIKVPTIRGESLLDLPMGIQDTQRIRIKGEGVKNVHTGDFGDQIVQIAIKFPKKLDENQKKLLKDLNQSFGFENPEDTGQEGLFDKIKAFFH